MIFSTGSIPWSGNGIPKKLDARIAAASGSALSSFATGIASDRDAAHAALMYPWSNGQAEAQITKLKLMKRQMYGRVKLDLLEARLAGATGMNPGFLHNM